jgi:IS30 family transposase
MRFKRRFKLTEQQRNDMWRRWKAGQSLHEIGRAFSKDHVCIQFMLAQHGGIAPAARRRSALTLTLAERENISRGIACGASIREIAKGLQLAGDLCIEPVTPISKRGTRRCVPSDVFWP